jgi:RNA polymerase sigma factor (sigma-70 family)
MIDQLTEHDARRLIKALYRAAKRQQVRGSMYHDLDDYVNVGLDGVLAASRRYKPTGGANFVNFVMFRAEGAIKYTSTDYLRWLRLPWNGDAQAPYGAKVVRHRVSYFTSKVVNGGKRGVFRQSCGSREPISPEQPAADPFVSARLQKIPGRDGEIIRMVYNGWRWRQIAQHYGVSEARVHHLKPRLRKKLAEVGIRRQALCG